MQEQGRLRSLPLSGACMLQSFGCMGWAVCR